MQVKKIESSDQNVKKFVFDFGNAVAEAVLYKYPTYADRTVICCSTQSGCPIGCRFCGSGDAFVRNLTGEEIVAQVERCMSEVLDAEGAISGDIKKLQIMFMSMGEPMLNYKNLEWAIRDLNRRFPQAALLISTSAPKVNYTPLMRLSKEIDKVGLQFSVHESTDEARNKLVPFKDKLNLAQIGQMGALWATVTGRQAFFNYCAHEGNTSGEDAERLNALFSPQFWQATVSVICERDESIAAANQRQRDLANGFMSKLLERGFSVRCFDPAGQDDIGGGCGQLWFVQDWMRQHPELARPSVGRHHPIIHTPR